MDEYQGQEMSPLAMQMASTGREEFEKWRFNIEDILNDKEYNLRGYFWDRTANKGEGAWVQKGIPRVNQTGAKAILSQIPINKITSLTTLDIDEILVEVKTLAFNLNRMFFLHHDLYGIQSPTDGQALLWDIIWFTFNGLKQSEGAVAMKSLAEVGPTTRHIYQETPQGSKGFLHLGRKKEN